MFPGLGEPVYTCPKLDQHGTQSVIGLGAPRPGLHATPLVICVTLGGPTYPPSTGDRELCTFSNPTDLELLLSTSLSAQVGTQVCKTTRQRFCFVYRPDKVGNSGYPQILLVWIVLSV